MHTNFIEENLDSLLPKLQVPDEIMAQGTLGLILYEEMEKLERSLKREQVLSPFVIETGLRVNHVLNRKFHFNVLNQESQVDVQYIEPDIYLMRINKSGPWRKINGIMKKRNNVLEISTEIDGSHSKANIVKINNILHIFTVVSEHSFLFLLI